MAGTTDPVVNTPGVIVEVEARIVVATTGEVEMEDAVVPEVVAELVDGVVKANDHKGADPEAETDNENPREYGLLDSPFVSTSVSQLPFPLFSSELPVSQTISTLNSIQFDVDIAPHVNPVRIDVEEQHEMQVLGFVGFCMFFSLPGFTVRFHVQMHYRGSGAELLAYCWMLVHTVIVVSNLFCLFWCLRYAV